LQLCDSSSSTTTLWQRLPNQSGRGAKRSKYKHKEASAVAEFDGASRPQYGRSVPLPAQLPGDPAAKGRLFAEQCHKTGTVCLP